MKEKAIQYTRLYILQLLTIFGTFGACNIFRRYMRQQMVTSKISHHFNSVKTSSKLKRFWMAAILLFLSTSAYSRYTVVGCVSDDTGYLYTNPSGMNSPRGSWYGPAYETSAVVTAGQLGYGNYCRPTNIGNCVIRTKSRCTECTGPYDYLAGWGSDYYYEQSGQLVGYYACPIDDYVIYIIGAMAITGFFFIRKRQLI
jgi:hypothetical protein